MTSALPEPQRQPKSALDTDAVLAAYRRWAGIYDLLFGGVSAFGRKEAVAAVNRLPGTDVLEVGVGTGLALPHYRRDKRITGIDLSAAMLERARRRVREERLAHVRDLLEMDAEAMSFPAGSFDIAVAMFVASVVPHPRRLLAEMRRVTRPGGRLVVCEFSRIAFGPADMLYRRYLLTVLPAIARRTARNPEAYEYLAESIAGWPAQRELAGLITSAGWTSARWRDLSLGVVAVHVARNRR